MKKIILTIGFLGLFFCIPAFAQKSGTVEVIKDPQIDSLIAKRARLNKPVGKSPATISTAGFRIQLFSGSDRNKAFAEQTRFKSLYPKINSYISYTEPNYKLRVGDFRTRLEAEKVMNELKKDYPTSFLFSEKVNLK
ncbi:MAG: SPOR domain-containing protein [Daejeonella sp.]